MFSIYVINGLPGTGKTTFGQLVQQELSDLGISFLHTSSIDLIKHLMLEERAWSPDMLDSSFWSEIKRIRDLITNLDWDGYTKNEYWRGVMSGFKLAVLEKFPNIINDWILNQASALGEGGVLFVDIREPRNIDLFKRYCEQKCVGEVCSVLVTRDTNYAYDNISDASVPNYEYDVIVHNPECSEGEDPLLGFRSEVRNFVSENISNVNRVELGF